MVTWICVGGLWLGFFVLVSLSGFIFGIISVDLLVPGRCRAEGSNERIVRRAYEGAHQQRVRAAPNVVRFTCSCILCATPDLLLKHPDAIVVTYK
jgi:hypothetical protein